MLWRVVSFRGQILCLRFGICLAHHNSQLVSNVDTSLQILDHLDIDV